ncbi:MULTISPECIES: FAD:protein FMN transferase [Clostridium]|uniref:FAD:protein FMN transferase n=1 Tax=Clostridium TaxID=1485 RepID=UPI0009C1175B|nr:MULTISPECIES: FAD:protein FMN transferase [Clostridium]PJI09312.1 FAD:protein FMN transferase [Clostridium sp. CT7]
MFIQFNNDPSYDIPHTKNFYSFGTTISLTAYCKNSDAAIDESIKKLNTLNDKLSAFNKYSEISSITEAAGKNFVKVSAETYFLIKKSVYYSNLTHGTFDPTIRPIVSLWNIGKENFKIPTETEVISSLKLVNYKDILFDDKGTSIMLRNKNQSIDVGGIAKGYAADEIKSIFKKHKIKKGIIDLGGNLMLVGKKGFRENWNIGIQNPLAYTGNYVGILSLKDKSVVTSGNYERYSIVGSRFFHHIIDPLTGYPSDNEVISITIISDKSLDGDGLSTGIYIMGVNAGGNLINSLKGLDAIFITKGKEIYLTKGIKDNFQITNQEFKLSGVI